MRKRLEHPVLGLLVPSEWGEHVTLRRFPFLPEFAQSHDDPADRDRPLIADWQRHIPTLAPRAREFPLRGGLHREGVFEVYVEYLREEETPSAEQVAAFAAFIGNEEQICRNLVDAMLRFYRAARRVIPDCFSYPPSHAREFPDDPDAAGLATVLEFDSLILPTWAVAGVSPLIVSWGPAWDEEHGLQSLVYNGQVVIIGTDEVRNMESWPGDECFNLVWNRSVMTPAEIAAVDAYCRAHATGS